RVAGVRLARRRRAAERAVGREIFRMLLLDLPSGRNCVAWIRRSGKIVRSIVQTDRDELLWVGQPRELKYAGHEGDQQRYHRGTFDRRRSSLVEPERWLSSRKHVASRCSSPIKLNHVEADAIARPDEPDHLDIEVGLRSPQRQCEEELAEGCYRDIVLLFPRQLQALTIDNGGMQDAAIRRPGQIAAAIASRRPRFPTDGYICDTALLDLVAVNAISARHATVEILRGFRVAVIDLPIAIEVPVSFAHAVDRPASIERETRNLLRRTADRPIG